MDSRLAYSILPYTRLELPGWGHLFNFFKVGSIDPYSEWKTAPTKIIRHRWHGYLMKLDLSNWSERHTYFLGRYYDLDLQLAMSQVLEPGDRFVDIGANNGMITLHGAALVTDSGSVEIFEPNPECCRRIEEVLELNNINHVKLHQMGLSDQSDTLTLSVITDHSGMGTLASPGDTYDKMVSKTFEVPVFVGDDVLMQNSMPIKFIKIDVEGFEFRDLKGLQNTLKTWHPVVITEVVKDWLERDNTNRTEIYQFMKQLGYLPYGLTEKRRFLGHKLALGTIPEDNVEDAEFTDFLWLHPESSANKILKPFIY